MQMGLGVVKVAAGAALIKFSGGAGATVGAGLIASGAGDVVGGAAAQS